MLCFFQESINLCGFDDSFKFYVVLMLPHAGLALLGHFYSFLQRRYKHIFFYAVQEQAAGHLHQHRHFNRALGQSRVECIASEC